MITVYVEKKRHPIKKYNYLAAWSCEGVAHTDWFYNLSEVKEYFHGDCEIVEMKGDAK